MVLNGEEGLECEVHVNGIYLEHVFEFKFLGCVYYKAGTDGTDVWIVDGAVAQSLL